MSSTAGPLDSPAVDPLKEKADTLDVLRAAAGAAEEFRCGPRPNSPYSSRAGFLTAGQYASSRRQDETVVWDASIVQPG